MKLIKDSSLLSRLINGLKFLGSKKNETCVTSTSGPIILKKEFCMSSRVLIEIVAF